MSSHSDKAFRDPSRPLNERVADLLAQLTLEEKLGLLHQYQAPVPRLGMGRFVTGTEVLHGLAWLGEATVFPQAIGLASSWNTDLVRSVGAAVGDEVRGLHNREPDRVGLNVWGPVVNPLRDPRWGRNEEGYSEDPYLTAEMGAAYAWGLRGDHPTHLRTAPVLKHFLAYNNETDCESTSSNLPPRVLHEYELPAYRTAIAQGAAEGIMCSYNAVNGRPTHLSPLINEVVRKWTDDELFIVSDATAPSHVVTQQHYYPDHVTGHAALLKAGIDSFTDNRDLADPTIERLAEALRLGLIDVADVDNAVRRALRVRFRLGEFDPPGWCPYEDTPTDVINSPEHQALAREAARQATVLLRNDDGVLPLDPGRIRRIAVIGPTADQVHTDWYSGTLPYSVSIVRGIAEHLPDAEVTFAEGIDRVVIRCAPTGDCLTTAGGPDGTGLTVGRDSGEAAARFDLADWGNGIVTLRSVAHGRYLAPNESGALVSASAQPGGWRVQETFVPEARGDVTVLRHCATGRYVRVDDDGVARLGADSARHATGFVIDRVSSGVEAAVAAAREADMTVVVMGNHPLINGREDDDRSDLRLSPAQEALLRAVHAVDPRTVLILVTGYPCAVNWADAHVPAILWSCHGGQEAGRAMADVLFGDAAPAGRLTQTWYADVADLPDLLEYDVITAESTYQYFRGTPLYPFGHGLTYSSFTYADLRMSADQIPSDGTVTISFEIANTGGLDSDEVVQVYTRQSRSRVKQPLRRLRAFRRVPVPAGERRRVSFDIPATDLAFWDATRGRPVVEAACHDVLVGRSSSDIRLTARLEVEGEHIPPWDASQPMPAFSADDRGAVRPVDATKETGDAVLATVESDWVAFRGVDFGTGVHGCVMRLSSTHDQEADVSLVLDDRLSGEVLATVTVKGAADRYAWNEVTVRTVPVAGVHDLYVVFGASGLCLRDLRFLRDDSPQAPRLDM
ncbi:glycoside hydrolase family 3 protein [Streptomyces capitiformicae]|uniref:Exo-alpha-(1->6)-L-arabinopyranosidase n=1 Tax=Streptomyces capitiformicae TaxID=2014920 RepID=A0A919GH91_9ACTN|nr:glycoside hydrolase family 3 protein [Streptomyces capitiformicae]GHH84727.1 beta-glucosidase [Streptomyces capitiformicae]